MLDIGIINLNKDLAFIGVDVRFNAISKIYIHLYATLSNPLARFMKR